jgi:hypothetical protein
MNSQRSRRCATGSRADSPATRPCARAPRPAYSASPAVLPSTCMATSVQLGVRGGKNTCPYSTPTDSTSSAGHNSMFSPQRQLRDARDDTQ